MAEKEKVIRIYYKNTPIVLPVDEVKELGSATVFISDHDVSKEFYEIDKQLKKDLIELFNEYMLVV